MNHQPESLRVQVPPDASNVSEIRVSRLTHSFHMELDRAGRPQDGTQIPSRMNERPVLQCHQWWARCFALVQAACMVPGAYHQKLPSSRHSVEGTCWPAMSAPQLYILQLGHSASRWRRWKSKVELCVVSVVSHVSVWCRPEADCRYRRAVDLALSPDLHQIQAPGLAR